MKHFTSKIYLVTYECGIGRYSRSYGISGAFNKPTEASRHIAKLEKEQSNKMPAQKIQYRIQTLDLDNPLTTELFRFEY